MQEYKYIDIFDNENNQLTIEQQEFFKNSVARDIGGNLFVVYHSSNIEFNEFDYKYLNLKGNKLPAFWFTNNKDRRNAFGEYSMLVYINIINPINRLHIHLTLEQINKIIGGRLTQEQLDNIITNNKLTSDYDLIYYFSPKNNIEIYKKYIDKVIKVTKYDGYIFPDKIHNEITYAIFKPNQIKSITNKVPTQSNNIHN